jgi:HD superfamily phosphodiesterase
MNIVVSDGLWKVHEDVVIAAALLHDVCDHKYAAESIPRAELDEFVRREFDAWTAGRILWVIDNVSYSKEASGRSAKPDTELDRLHLSIVCDADRLEALGEAGLRRCEEYVRRIGGSVPDDVVRHCHEKLLRLYPGFFIRTWTGRAIARPLHRAVEEYVRAHSRDAVTVVHSTEITQE